MTTRKERSQASTEASELSSKYTNVEHVPRCLIGWHNDTDDENNENDAVHVFIIIVAFVVVVVAVCCVGDGRLPVIDRGMGEPHRSIPSINDETLGIVIGHS